MAGAKKLDSHNTETKAWAAKSLWSLDSQNTHTEKIIQNWLFKPKKWFLRSKNIVFWGPKILIFEVQKYWFLRPKNIDFWGPKILIFEALNIDFWGPKILIFEVVKTIENQKARLKKQEKSIAIEKTKCDWKKSILESLGWRASSCQRRRRRRFRQPGRS